MKDFFVSYNSKDKEWAEWIAYTLEGANYSTVIQAWDFAVGGNFVSEMQQALQETERLVMVLSDDYLEAMFAQAEWAAVFATDPIGLQRRLLPLMVRECEPDGLLGPIVYLKLYELAEADAAAAMLDAVSRGRGKPAVRPPFPGPP